MNLIAILTDTGVMDVFLLTVVELESYVVYVDKMLVMLSKVVRKRRLYTFQRLFLSPRSRIYVC